MAGAGEIRAELGAMRKARLVEAAAILEITPTELLRRLVDEHVANLSSSDKPPTNRRQTAGGPPAERRESAGSVTGCEVGAESDFNKPPTKCQQSAGESPVECRASAGLTPPPLHPSSPSLSPPVQGEREEGKGGPGETPTAKRSRTAGPTRTEKMAGFDEWWAEYPKKVNKRKAEAEWERAHGDGSAAERLDVLTSQKLTSRGRAGIFPDPHRYIRDRRWHDDRGAWDDLGNLPDRIQQREEQRRQELLAPGFRSEVPEFQPEESLAILAEWLPEDLPSRLSYDDRIRSLAGADLEGIEQSLKAIERDILTSFKDSLAPEQRASVRDRIEGMVKKLRGRFSESELQERRHQFGRQVLLRMLRLPQGLTLFHTYPAKTDSAACAAYRAALDEAAGAR